MPSSVSSYLLKPPHRLGRAPRLRLSRATASTASFGAFEPRRATRLKFVQVRHEEMAAFMACAHAKFTGEVGVCLATSGPGAIHLLNGLYDAKMDHQPVVAIVGQQARAALGGDYQQEVDLQHAVQGRRARVRAAWRRRPTQVRHLVDRAVRIARAERTVTCIIVPNDVQELDAVEQPPHEHGTVHTGHRLRARRASCRTRRTCSARRTCSTPARRWPCWSAPARCGATDEVIEVADLLGAGVAKALLGKAVLPDDLPFVTGSIGLLGTKPSWDLMSECDTLLMVGSSFPYSEFLPEEGQARGVQIDLDGRMLGIRYPMEVNLVGDSARDAARAAPAPEAQDRPRAGASSIEEDVARLVEACSRRARMNAAEPDQPAARVLGAVAAAARRLHPRRATRARRPTGSRATSRSGAGMMALALGQPGDHGPRRAVRHRAPSSPIPDRRSIALVGDGAMQMNGINELITIAKYWKEWRDPRLVVLVLNNRDLNQVTWEQRAMAGDPKFEASQDLPTSPTRATPRSLGLQRHPRRASPTRSARRGTQALRARPAGRGRGAHRPGRAAAAAAHHARAGAGLHLTPSSRATRDVGGIVAAGHQGGLGAVMPDKPAARSAAVARGERIERVDVRAFTIPTDAPESDGTLAWDATTLVLVEVARRRARAASATPTPTPRRAQLIRDALAALLRGQRRAATSPARCAGDGARGPQPRPARASPRWRSRRSTRRSGT